MRLWHQALLSILPGPRLLGQHRECCALRGGGWGRKHATVNYVFTHPYYWLYAYHMLVIKEMERRGYQANSLWLQQTYRGQLIGWDTSPFTQTASLEPRDTIYLEHDAEYLAACLENLAEKGVILENRENGL